MGKSKATIEWLWSRDDLGARAIYIPPFWVLNPNLRSEYINHSLDFLWWLSLPIFYIIKTIQGLKERKYWEYETSFIETFKDSS